MSHTIKEKRKLLARVGRILGQVEALERELALETECGRIMHMIAGIRGSVAGLMAEVVEDHVRTHLVDPDPGRNPGALNAEAAEQRYWAVFILWGVMIYAEIVDRAPFGSLARSADGLHISTYAGSLIIP